MRRLIVCLLATCHGIWAFSASAPPKTAAVFTDFVKFIEATQKEIISTLEAEEGPKGARFLMDPWEKEGGLGHGATCVLGK